MKILPDTNVLVGFFRDPGVRERFESKHQRPLLHMSSVVVLELFAGCRTNRERDALSAFLKPFEKAGRFVTPDLGAYTEAGRVLAGLGQDGIGKARRRQIVNDVLIAVSVARFGVVVVTSNASDFAVIEKHTPVRWMRPD